MIHDATANLDYRYDPENRMMGTGGFTYTGACPECSRRDADGNRIEKANGTTGTLYWYMTPGIVAESDLTGNLQSEYIFFDGERVARRDFPDNAVSYYFSDHLKTASVITDSAGNIKSESDYYPWGGEVQFTNNDTNHYKFTGKERDAETGLDYFGARYYSNGLGRFITPDWAAKAAAVPYADFADPQSLNLYTYVRNIPTSKVDPDGHECPQCPVIERFLEEVSETPAGQAIIQKGAQVAGAIGTGLVAGWSYTSGFAKKVWDGYAGACGQGSCISEFQRTRPDQQDQTSADPKKPGTLGKPDHQETVKEEAEKLGADSSREVKIKTPGGQKESRRADAAETDENGNYKPGGKIVQVIRPTPAGNVPKREQQAAQDIQNATGVKPELVPVRPLPKKEKEDEITG